MLIVTRKQHERVIIRHLGVEIVVEVNRISGSQARLAITAPPEVTINREEVQRQIDQGENLEQPQ